MSNIAVIGNLREIVQFKFFGFDIHPFDEITERKKIAQEIILNGGYEIIFVVENYYEDFKEIYDSLKSIRKEKLPVITSITNGIDFKNIGFNSVRNDIKKALGIDLLK
jgi:vacuolar-type H+-ATPase subunit F/Vma7